MSRRRQTWRRRLALAHYVADCRLAGRRYLLEETLGGRLQIYADRPGRLIYDNRGQVRYWLIG